jgi:uncharacterized membrane protein YbhN (UPF0104 family)
VRINLKEGRLKPAVLILITNGLGLSLGLAIIVSYILYAKEKLKSKTVKKVLVGFGITGIAYGVYVLLAAQTMGELFPKERYSVGAGIVILIGVFILLRLAFEKKAG